MMVWKLLIFLLVNIVTIATSTRDDVCGITTFFNPFHYTTRITNYYHARKWTRRQELKLMIVELVFGNSTAAELTGDDLSKHVILYTNTQNILWQKEALINFGLKQIDENDDLFRNCTKIVWLDSDVILQDGWIEETSKMLDNVSIGQVFTHLVRLPQGTFNPFAYWSEPRMKKMGFGNKEGQVQLSSAVRFQGGTTGFAWGARRDYLLKVKLYDKAIVGGFDALLYHALNDPRCEVRFNQEMADDFELWAENARQVFGAFNLGSPYVQIKAAAFWHGDTKDRNYQDRHDILLSHRFNPHQHVMLSEPDQGSLEWKAKTPCELRKAVFDMFVSRQEDGVISLDSVHQLPRFECSQLISERQCDS